MSNTMKPKLTKGEEITAGSLPHEPVITMTNYDTYLDEQLKDPGFRRLYKREYRKLKLRHFWHKLWQR